MLDTTALALPVFLKSGISIYEEELMTVLARTLIGGRLAHLNIRRFAITDKGYTGLVLTLAEKGDRFAAFKTCRAPFVLRKKESMYVFIGNAHFDGLERICLDTTEMEKVLLGR